MSLINTQEYTLSSDIVDALMNDWDIQLDANPYDPLGPLPPAYERYLSSTGVVYFTHHGTKKSGWHDPRFQFVSLQYVDELYIKFTFIWENAELTLKAKKLPNRI